MYLPYRFSITIFTLLCQISKLVSSECQTGVISDQSDPKNEKCHQYSTHDNNVASLHCKPICETGLTLQGLDALAFLLFACTIPTLLPTTEEEGSRPKKDLFCVQLSEMRCLAAFTKEPSKSQSNGDCTQCSRFRKNGTLGKSHCVPQLS